LSSGLKLARADEKKAPEEACPPIGSDQQTGYRQKRTALKKCHATTKLPDKTKPRTSDYSGLR
ncbi:hypothetical protein, partial [Sutterella wadsworthensis]|uniref:hypothetical protein n=1 Tax=Sutterella wadsworthensis TaxID=40545 RepID=UPI003076F5AD